MRALRIPPEQGNLYHGSPREIVCELHARHWQPDQPLSTYLATLACMLRVDLDPRASVDEHCSALLQRAVDTGLGEWVEASPVAPEPPA